MRAETAAVIAAVGLLAPPDQALFFHRSGRACGVRAAAAFVEDVGGAASLPRQDTRLDNLSSCELGCELRTRRDATGGSYIEKP